MGGFFSKLWEGLKSVLGLILPIAGKARGLAWGLRWVLGLVLFAAVLVGLHFLNQAVGLDKFLPGRPDHVRRNYLPILFVLICALWWLAWWLYRLLMAHEEYVEFPDITEAWDEALDALYRARIDLRDLPVFLVLGRPEGPMATLFQASRLDLEVKQAPSAPDAPLHVYATRDAIYVTCEGASVLGRHAALLAGTEKSKEATHLPEVEDDIEGTLAMTIRPGVAPGAVSEVQAYLARIRREGRTELTPQERRELRALVRKDDRNYQPPIRSREQTEEWSARLEHLSRLLVRDRHPYCPINGILLLVPFAATDGDQDAVDAGNTIRRDLATIRNAMGVNAPIISLVSDLETAPGFTEFLTHFKERERQQRIGQRYPLVPDLESRHNQGRSVEEERADSLDSLARWLFGSVVPRWVYKHFHVEKPGKEELPDALRANAGLFLFMHHLRERQRRLSKIFSLGIVAEEGEAPLFGGCYLGGTGADRERGQGFLPGVFNRLVERRKDGEKLEECVSWTARALEEDAHSQRLASLGLGFLALLGVAVVGLAGYYFFIRK
jgi:hypothetical protein